MREYERQRSKGTGVSIFRVLERLFQVPGVGRVKSEILFLQNCEI